MANTLLSLLVKLGMDISDYSNKLKDAENEAEKSSKNMGASFSKVGASMTKVGSAMTLGLTVPIIGAFGVMANKASDLSESVNKTKVVFNENADTILAWANKSATSFGLSKATALDAAGGFGAMFGAMGVGATETMNMSQGLVQLAADMGSLYNVDPSEMLEKLRSGMAGEAEPLRVFGVMISEANVKAQALKMGLGDSTGALSDQEKVLARYALIQSQAAVAQGDFANTSSGMANSTRIMKAELENVSASFGTQLIPIITQVLQQLIPLLEGFNNMDPATQKTILGVLGVIAVAGPLLVGIGSVCSAIGALITFFGAGGAAATALGGAGAFLSGTVFPFLASVIAAVGAPVLLLVAAVGVLIVVWNKFGADAMNTITMVRDIIASAFQRAIWWVDSLGGAFHGIASAMQSALNWVVNLQNKLLGLRLPDWLTPGSPTPFEMGLVGIGKQMSVLSRQKLPQFAAELNISASPASSIASALPNSQSEKSNRDDFPTFPTANEIGYAIVTQLQSHGMIG